MKYSIGQKVRVRGLTKIGEIMAYKIDGMIHGKGNIIEVVRYELNFGSYYKDWYYERDIINLEETKTYHFDNKFELGLLNMLIDINLDNKNFDILKKLVDERKIYE